MNNNNNSAMEKICNDANLLFPELNVRISDISHPNEAFLTRILVHTLRTFGLRIEPPHNIESEFADKSQVKRVFLSKLCRQVQHILQICFPGKTYTYYDIIEPTPKKTLTTLDVLFNYWCFYKMHKKEVIPPIMERHLERQALIASLAAKRRELEQKKEKGVQDKIDIAKCEANIRKLREELPRAETEQKEKYKVLRQLQSEMAIEEEKQSEVHSQVNHLKQLVVLDSDVAKIKMEMKQLAAQLESHKPEMAKHEQVYKERRLEVESITRLNDEIDKAFNILPSDTLSDYKEKLKLKDTIEKSHNSLVNKQQVLQDTKAKNQKILEQEEEKYKALILQCQTETSSKQEEIDEQKALIENINAELENIEQSEKILQERIAEEQLTGESLRNFELELIGNKENLSCNKI